MHALAKLMIDLEGDLYMTSLRRAEKLPLRSRSFKPCVTDRSKMSSLRFWQSCNFRFCRAPCKDVKKSHSARQGDSARRFEACNQAVVAQRVESLTYGPSLIALLSTAGLREAFRDCKDLEIMLPFNKPCKRIPSTQFEMLHV